ncbi:MAG TPA: tripartite tricarboxylate transporter permease, partial [Pseudorhizobium sp.]|nr:tripartite tricarboxylate transporter permease [Pseudorhizobium sp.]
SVIATLSGENLAKGMIAAILGLVIATIGSDPVTGGTRFTFGSSELLGGIEPVMIMVGLFAMSELLIQASKRGADERVTSRPRIQFPDWPLAKRLIPAQLIGNGIGTFEGVMPGAGGTIASFMAYNEARRWSRHPEEFGKGSPEGIAAPETANNTVAETALVPLLSFGIPGSNSTAILLGGFLIHGIVPGPMLFQKSGEVVYGLYAGLFTAAIGQLFIGMAMLPVCIWLVNRPRPYLNAFIFALILSGIYSIHNEAFDLGIMIAAGTLGFFMRMLRFPFLPTVLGLVLGYLVESNLRRSLVLSGDDWTIFIDDKISLGLLLLSFLFIGGSIGKRIYDMLRNRPSATFSESAES